VRFCVPECLQEEAGLLIEAKDLTRFYGSFCAVDHVSFSIDTGEIVGLLGPNGAGKTTTMRMLACFLPATEGTATVNGSDIHRNASDVRRQIGYMPESNPLYPEMRVREYLQFRCELKGVARNLRGKRIDECLDLCGLEDRVRDVIGTLSKGYRQRVGLADALLGSPRLLILDEPTIGLDPNQIRQTRDTIRQLSESHTILLSTHILQEVEAICERVLILDRGRVVADDNPQNLSDRTLLGSVIAELKGPVREMKTALAALEGVENVKVMKADEWTQFKITIAGEADVGESIFLAASSNGWSLRELTFARASLEDVFHRMTVGGRPVAE